MGDDMDPEDIKSLDSSEGAALNGEENHSSNSDIVQLEREEAEILEDAEEKRVRRTEEEEDEEDKGLQASVLSVSSGERELVELREKEQDLRSRETEEPLVLAEEPHRERERPEFMQVVPPMAMPPLPIVRLDPPSTTSTPVLPTTTSEAGEIYTTRGLHPPSILAPKPFMESLDQIKLSHIPLSHSEEHSVEAAQPAPEEPRPTALPKTTNPLSSTELLCGGAVLVAFVGVVAYGALAFCRK